MPAEGTDSSPEPVAEEILAWRVWQLSTDDNGEPVLQSATREIQWDGPTFTADAVPTQASPCGVYALREKGPLWQYHGAIRGQVALSGRVVEGSSGYRAERATIRSLEILRNTLPDVILLNLVDALESRYHVAVEYDAKALAQPVGSMKSQSQTGGIVINNSTNVSITGNSVCS